MAGQTGSLAVFAVTIICVVHTNAQFNSPFGGPGLRGGIGGITNPLNNGFGLGGGIGGGLGGGLGSNFGGINSPFSSNNLGSPFNGFNSEFSDFPGNRDSGLRGALGGNNFRNSPFGSFEPGFPGGNRAVGGDGFFNNGGGFDEYRSGVIRGELVEENGVITITATVEDGNPSPSVYEWTVQKPDGTFETFEAGKGGSTVPTQGGVFSPPSTTLTVREPADIVRTFTLTVSSDPANERSWETSRSWEAPATTGRPRQNVRDRDTPRRNRNRNQNQDAPQNDNEATNA